MQGILTVVEQIKNGTPQAVAISQTSQVVSNTFLINTEDSYAFAFQVTASAVTGTAGIVKLQHSIDGTNFTDVDATNAKVTLTSATRFPLLLSAYATNFLAKMPLYRWVRFVCTTTGADTCTLSSILVQLHF